MKVCWFNRCENHGAKEFVPVGVNYLELGGNERVLEIYSSWGKWHFFTEFYWTAKH